MGFNSRDTADHLRSPMTDTPLSHRIRSVRQTIWSSALYRLARRIAATATRPFRRFEVATIIRKSLIGPIETFRGDGEIEIVQASAEEVERAAQSLRRPGPDRREMFRWRLGHGYVCFVARAGAGIVGYNWILMRPGTDDGDIVALGEGEAFQFDLYVDENWRGNRIAAMLWSAMHLFEKQHGCTAAYSKVSLLNRKSQRAVRRAGWTTSGVVLRVVGSKRGGWPIITLWGSAHPLARLRSK
jgi:GNAT superfamily N-acetyltransferase